MVAVLEDAVATLARDMRDQQTWRWFDSDDVRWPFSFRNVCDVLALDAEAVRGALREWRVEVLTGRTADRKPKAPPVVEYAMTAREDEK